MNIKIKGAKKHQWKTALDMVVANTQTIDLKGVLNGVVVRKGELALYLYLSDSGKTLVACVQTDGAWD